MYRVEFSKDATKALRRMARNVRKTVTKKIDELAADPHAVNPNVKPLVERDGYRLRVGNLRVIYTIDDGALLVHVVDMGPRGGIYK